MPASFDFAQLHVKDEVIIAVDPPQHVLQSANVDSCHSSFISGSLKVGCAFHVLNDGDVFDHCFAFLLAGVVCFDVVTIDNLPPNCKRNRGQIAKITKIIAETRKRRAKR